MAELPTLSELAWGILEQSAGTVSRLNWDKVAPGPRDALLAIGAVKAVVLKPAGKTTSRKLGTPPVIGVAVTEAGTKLLADRRAQKQGR